MNMILSGREMQVILGVHTMYVHIPFTTTQKRPLLGIEQDVLDALWMRVLSARDSLVENRDWTAEDRQNMLSRTTSLELTQQERALLQELFDRCLAEVPTERLLNPYLPPRITRQDVTGLLERLRGGGD